MHIELPPSARRGWLQRIATTMLLLGGLGATAQATQASLVLDASTGRVLSEEHADEITPPASLTKMMTIYLTFQALEAGRLTLDEKLPVSAHAVGMAPTKLGLRAGQTIAVRDCILGMVTKSANDAATVVAEKLGGSESDFVEMMNAQGLLLGMSHTHFASASGLPNRPDGTTARDMSRLATALYRDFPSRVPVFATREFTFHGRLVRGHNHLMERYAGMDGLKTGYTAAAGFNLASTAVRNGHRLFGVVLGERSARARDDLMAQLLDGGFGQWQTSPARIAAANGPEHGTARKVLAALSPIATAEADTVPAAALHNSPVRHETTRRSTAPPQAGSVAHAKRHRKATLRVADVTAKQAGCGSRSKSGHACSVSVHAHARREPARLAHRGAMASNTPSPEQRD